MLADSYPILNFFWTMLMFFGLVIWIYLIFVVFLDIVRSHDLGGFAKALWVILIIFLPLIGVFAYLIVRGGSMHERSIDQAKAQKEQFDNYVRETAGTATPADQLATLAGLHDQ